MNLWIVVTILEEFLEDCQKFSVYGTNSSYLQNFAQMQTSDVLLIQLRAKSQNHNFAYLGPFEIIDSLPIWAQVEETKTPWHKIKPVDGPRWLQKFPWCVFLAQTDSYIDSLRVLKNNSDPRVGLIKNKDALDIIRNLTQDEYLPQNSSQGYRTNRGVWVRSRAEYMIDNWFSERGIVTFYERSIFLCNQRFLPDWYIPQLNLYIEYLGMLGNKKYDLDWKNKKSIYDKKKLRYVVLDDSDLVYLNNSIPQKIPQIKPLLMDHK